MAGEKCERKRIRRKHLGEVRRVMKCVDKYSERSEIRLVCIPTTFSIRKMILDPLKVTAQVF